MLFLYTTLLILFPLFNAQILFQERVDDQVPIDIFNDDISAWQGHKVCVDCQDQAKAKDNNNKRDVCLLCNISELTKPTVLEKVMGHGAAIFNF